MFAILVIFTTVQLVKQVPQCALTPTTTSFDLTLTSQSVSVLMEGVPQGIDAEQVLSVRSRLRSRTRTELTLLTLQDLHELEGVVEVHDLHIWSLSMG